jgi:hypothetical protein
MSEFGKITLIVLFVYISAVIGFNVYVWGGTEQSEQAKWDRIKAHLLRNEHQNWSQLREELNDV